MALIQKAEEQVKQKGGIAKSRQNSSRTPAVSGVVTGRYAENKMYPAVGGWAVEKQLLWTCFLSLLVVLLVLLPFGIFVLWSLWCC